MNETTAPSQTSTGYISLIRGNANFRNLWLGQIVSLLGDWFNLIASASLIAQLTETGIAVGGLFVVRMLAPFLISPLAGVWVDRYDRRKLLILTDIIRGLTVLGLLLVRKPEHVWLLYSLTAIQLGLSGVFFPARAAILPDIVSPQELGAANALSSATWSVMLAVGAALGGLSAGIWGIYPSFVIDALTFFVSAVFVYKVKYQLSSGLSEVKTSISASLRQYVDGLRYLTKHVDIFMTALLKAAAALAISGVFQVVQVVVAKEIFVIGEGGGISLGWMYMSVGIGTGIGPIFARRFTGDRYHDMRWAIVIGYAIAATGLAITATLQSFPIVLIGTFLRGFGVGINWVFSAQLLLQLVPNRVRGRVFSSEFALFTLASAIGSMAGGWALDNSGLEVADIIGALTWSALVPGILWGLWVLFGKRTEPKLAEAGID